MAPKQGRVRDSPADTDLVPGVAWTSMFLQVMFIPLDPTSFWGVPMVDVGVVPRLTLDSSS